MFTTNFYNGQIDFKKADSRNSPQKLVNNNTLVSKQNKK